jgi:hypothetical protein
LVLAYQLALASFFGGYSMIDMNELFYLGVVEVIVLGVVSLFVRGE